MPEQIVLSVAVNSGKATSDIKQFSTTAKTELKQVQDTTTTSLSATGRSAQTMGQKFAGAGSAISGANAALQLMGRQGPPALQTLASAAAAVAVSGFGTMTLALVGATGLISLIASLGTESEDAASKVDVLTERLERQRDVVREMVDLQHQRQRQLRAVSEGRSEGDQALIDRQRDAEADLRSADRAIEARNAEITRLQNTIGNFGVDADKVQELIEEEREALESAERDRRVALSQIASIKRARELTLVVEEKITQERERQRRANEKITPTGISAASALDFANTLGREPERFGGTRAPGPDFFGTFNEDEATARAMGIAGVRQPWQIPRAPVALPDSAPSPSADVPASLTDLQRDAQSRASSLTRSMASSFASALAGEDYADVGRSIAQSVANSLADAAISGALRGFGVEKAFASGFESIGGAFTGSGG